MIAYPTDSGYALGCRIGDADAARRIRRIRGVGDDHLLTLMLNDLSEIGHFARLDNWQFRIVRRGTPGSFTFVLPATREVPRRLQHPRRSTVGLARVRAPVVRALLVGIERAGPVVDADPSRRDRAAARRGVDSRGDSSATSTSSSMRARAPRQPTTVVDLASEPGRIVRLGAGDPARLGLDGGRLTPDRPARRPSRAGKGQLG